MFILSLRLGHTFSIYQTTDTLKQINAQSDSLQNIKYSSDVPIWEHFTESIPMTFPFTFKGKRISKS